MGHLVCNPLRITNKVLTLVVLLVSLSICNPCTPGTVLLQYTVFKVDSNTTIGIAIGDGNNEMINKQYRDAKTYSLESACLPVTPGYRYTLCLSSSLDQGWVSSSHITLYGSYGDPILTASGHSNYTVTEIFLQNRVYKGATWRFAHGVVPSTWMTQSVEDWSSVTYPSNQILSGNQFFRITLSGENASLFPPAYLAKFRYSYGIVVYMNGNEVFRDHLGEGFLSPTSVPTSHYNTTTYRGYIRTFADLQASSVVLAVGLFFPPSHPSSLLDFDGYLQDMGKSVYSASTPITGVTSSFYQHVFDGDVVTGYSIHPNDVLQMEMPEDLLPQVTGFAFQFKSLSETPLNYSIVVTGFQNPSSSGRVIATIDPLCMASTPVTSIHLGYHHVGYRVYRLQFISTKESTFVLKKVYPLVAFTQPYSSIPYDQSIFPITLGVDKIEAIPLQGDFYECVAQPSLPAGLQLRSEDCQVSGIPKIDVGTTTFTLVSNRPPATATIQLQASVCSGHYLHMQVVMPADPQPLSVTVRYPTSGDLIWSYSSLNGERSDGMICVESNSISITLGSENNRNWKEGTLFTIWERSCGQDIELYTGFYSHLLTIPKEEILHIAIPVLPCSTWSMKDVEVSIPSHWTTSFQESWSEETFPFHSPTSSIQLYQKQFQVSQVQSVNTLELAVRFRFGCVVYLNGREVYRRGVNELYELTGDLGEVQWIQTSIPLRVYGVSMSESDGESMSDSNGESVSESNGVSINESNPSPITESNGDSITESNPSPSFIAMINNGTNLVAIAIITPPNYLQSDFDCFIVLNQQAITLRNTHFTVQSDLDNTEKIFSMNPDNGFDYVTGHHTITLQYNHHRRVFINQITFSSSLTSLFNGPTNVTLYGSNPEEGEEPTLLLSMESIGYWEAGQTQVILFPSRKAFNTYSFSGFDSEWESEIQLAIGLFSEKQNHEASCNYFQEVTAYFFHDLPEQIPNCTYFTDFTVYPSLPNGLFLDSVTGTLLGRPVDVSETIEYSVSARMYNQNVYSTFVFTLTILNCLTANRTSLGVDVQKMTTSPQSVMITGNTFSFYRAALKNQLIAHTIWTFCVDPGPYSISLGLPNGDRDRKKGYLITNDVFRIPLAEGFFDSQEETINLSVHLPPLLINPNAVWKFKVDSIDFAQESWYSIPYDDRSWLSNQQTVFRVADGLIVFARYSFTMEELDKEKVLYLSVTFQGGFLLFVDGVLVARYYLNEGELFPTKYGSSISHITVPLERVHFSAGDHVIAVELHKHPDGEGSVEFSLSAVFGEDFFAVMIDDIDTTSVSQDGEPTSAYVIFDGDIREGISVYLSRDSFVQFDFVNKVIPPFNYFQLFTEDCSFEWTIQGGYADSDYLYDLTSGSFLLFEFGVPQQGYTPAGLLHYDRLNLRIHSPDTRFVNIYEIRFFYQTGTGLRCEEEGWPFVYHLEYSAIPCDGDSEGMQYRVCESGRLGPVISDCVLHESTYFSYGESIRILKDVDVGVIEPEFDSLLYYFSITPPLPKGLKMNSETGAITGAIEVMVESMSFTVTGMNERSLLTTQFVLLVENAACYDSTFIPYPLGSTRNVDCSERGAILGTIVKRCITSNGILEWVDDGDSCVMTISLITAGVISFFITVLLLVFTYWIVNFNDQEEKHVRELSNRIKHVGEWVNKQSLQSSSHVDTKVLHVCEKCKTNNIHCFGALFFFTMEKTFDPPGRRWYR